MHIRLPFFPLLLSPFLCRTSPVGSDNAAATAAPGNFQLDDDVCPDYETCSVKGKGYWNTLQTTILQPAPVDRTDGLAVFNQYYDSQKLAPQNYDTRLGQDLLNHGLKFPSNAFSVWYTYPKGYDTGEETGDALSAPYVNIINTHDGVLIGKMNFRNMDKTDKLPWSELMYQQWQISKAADDERASKYPFFLPGNNLSSLQYVLRDTVENKATMDVMRLAYTKTGYTPQQDPTWRLWTEQETPNWFFALLGTDNCKGVVWLLNDHAKEAGKKEVAEIWTRWGVFKPDIWMVIKSAEWIKWVNPRGASDDESQPLNLG
ncbi:MAG: hypothetical protein LQ338_005378, partial [Usnochroma carphineum]